MQNSDLAPFVLRFISLQMNGNEDFIEFPGCNWLFKSTWPSAHALICQIEHMVFALSLYGLSFDSSISPELSTIQIKSSIRDHPSE